MLVLSRDLYQTVMLGDDIEVKILGVRDSKVLLGFKAPKSITVHREEVYRRINPIIGNDNQFKEKL